MLNIKLNKSALIISLFTLIAYHLYFYKFVLKNINLSTLNGVWLLAGLTILAIIFNALFYYIILFLFKKVGKWIISITFIINSITLYFIKTYGVIIDKSMIGNVFNTNYDEASSFFSITLIVFVILLGIVPSFLLFKIKIEPVKIKKFFINIALAVTFILAFAWGNSSNWLWIDKHSKTLGALVMPWSYLVNTYRYFYHKSLENQEEILLSDATIKDNQKAVAVLVIGESARSKNFSLYGYEKETNPLLSKMENLYHYKAKSCATYTTAGVKCMLDYKHTGTLYETLPNYLYRNKVDVIWRSSNWGQPKLKIENYKERKDLKDSCNDRKIEYDEVLICNLQKEIRESKSNKILIILHTSTSHGPSYYEKYPPEFEKFTPVCRSVELSECSQEELINAYDNTLLYTDYILAETINQLKQLKEYKSTMLFVSDHGESLGENNLYMHGLPMSVAPEEQFDIPFIVWVSGSTMQLKPNAELSQHNVFHSILNFLSVESPIYNEDLNIFKK